LVVAWIPGSVGLALAILTALFLASVSIPWEARLRRSNERREESALRRGGTQLGAALLLGLLGPFLRGFLSVTASALFLSVLLGTPPCDRLPAWTDSEAMRVGLIGGAAAIGYAALLRRFHIETGRAGLAWLLCGLVLGGVTRWLLGGRGW
jgi:hypothetical protein